MAVISLLVILTLSLLITRVATVALTLTGLSRESAQFQARSAFTGVGFTTRESEQVVNHPVRRRIVLLLMVLGNAGVVTALASLILSFANLEGEVWWPRLVALGGGVAFLWAVAHSRWVDRWLSGLIRWALSRWTHLDVRDYAALLNLAQGYRVAELQVQPGDWLAGRRLADIRLRDEGVLVLGIHRPDGSYIGAPRGHTEIRPGDRLIVYGRAPLLAELDQRCSGASGDQAHTKAVEAQRRILAQEEGY